MSEKRIAVLGDEGFTLGFELIGLKEVRRPDNLDHKVKELIEDDELGIVIAEENEMENLNDELLKTVKQSVDPVFVLLSEDYSNDELNSQIKKAIGADIST